MRPLRQNPVPLAAGRVSEWLSRAAKTSSEDTPSQFDLQAHHLIARFGLTRAHASVIASLHFGEMRS